MMQSWLTTIPRRITASGNRIHVSTRGLALALIAILIAILATRFTIYLRYALAAVRYPFELFDAEGIVWQQAMLIPGERMYGDINRFPFIVFHYPPVYHLVVHAVATLGVDPLLAGRGISLLASLVAGALAALLAFHTTRNEAGRLASLAGAATAGLVFFCFYPVIGCSPLMRVDMLAVALSFLGTWCAARSANRPILLYVAMTLFVLAAFTKQTCFAAPLATMAVMALVNPKRTLEVLCFGLLLGGVAALSLIWATDGRFLRHIILYNINRFSLEHVEFEMLKQLPHLGLVVLAMVAVFIGWKQLGIQRARQNPTSLRHYLASSEAAQSMAILTLYLGIATCMLVTLGKSGAGLNYFVEWMGILSVLIGTLVAAIARQQLLRTGHGVGRTPVVFALLLLLLMQVLRVPASADYGFADMAQSQQLEDLVARIRVTSRPVLSDDMVLLMKAGKGVPWEPAIFTELASTGRWDERQIINLISAHYFEFVITHGHEGLYTPAVAHAIETAYPRTEETGGHTIHFP